MQPDVDGWTASATPEQLERLEAGETTYLEMLLELDGAVIGSLGGIEVADEEDPYLRVCAADLALEFLA